MPAKKTSAVKPAAKPAAKRQAAKAPAKPAAKKTAPRSSKAKPAPKPAAAEKTSIKKAVAAKKVIAAKTPAKKPLKQPAKAAVPPGLPEQIRDVILRVLDERQAENILTVDLRGRSSIADYLIIASGRAARQIAAIADIARDELAKIGVRQVRTEGTAEGNWVLLDAGDVILHLFRPEVRQFYNIEQIYGEDLPA